MMVFPSAAKCDIKLPAIFGDHMVLQRDAKIPVWGWAGAGEKVTVSLAQGQAVEATADAQGKWQVELPAMTAGGPYELKVQGSTAITFKDVLVGEVWLCSGQSNMEWTVYNSLDPQKEMAAATDTGIRHIKVPLKIASTPQDNIQATWQVSSPQTVGGFTAAGYFMAKKLHKELGVPIGLINSSWGGTRIEPWTAPVGFEGVEKLRDIETLIQRKQPQHPLYKQGLEAYLSTLDAWSRDARSTMAAGKAVTPAPPFPAELAPFSLNTDPTALYNAMIHPLVGYGMRGAIWYQGESNHSEGSLYTDKMKALIHGWRKIWKQGDFPFYFVQIAPFMYGEENPTVMPVFWEAQFAAAKQIANTGIVTTTDIGDIHDIHPKNKQEVGRRLALLALKYTYGKQDVVAVGPVFKSLKTEGNNLRVTFDHAEGGLKSRDGQPLNWFEIIGADSGYVKAEAKIEGDSVVLAAPSVIHPTAVRFGWSKIAEPNLANGAGLPAYPFKAGEVQSVDLLKGKIPELAAYKLVYDLDLANLSYAPNYDEDNSDSIKEPFDRVAWLVELIAADGLPRYCFVSADAFTDDLKKLGIPTADSKAVFQTQIKNGRVQSNVAGLPAGEVADALNIEFWPSNYGPANTAAVPNASDALYDSGDQISGEGTGYGSMQVHHYAKGLTMFAINNWNAGAKGDLGIGNSDGQSRDWTFKQNAGGYVQKRLRVFVRPKKQG